MELRNYAEQQRAFSKELINAQDSLSQLEKEKKQYVDKLTKFKSEIQDITELNAAECVKILANAKTIEVQRLIMPLSNAFELKINNEKELAHQQELNYALEANKEISGSLDKCTNFLEQYDQAIAEEKTIYLDKMAVKNRKIAKLIKFLLFVLVIAGVAVFALISNKNPGVIG